jgi:hypothetical protein
VPDVSSPAWLRSPFAANEDSTMSMIGNLARIPEATRQRLHQEPKQITQFLYPKVIGSRPKSGSGILGHLFGRKKPRQETPPSSTESLPEQDTMDLDKAWHGLHFLFTGSDWTGDFPQGFLVTCGEPVGDVDVGYGPARSFSPGEVENIARFLEGLDEATLRHRLDPKKMADLEIYPSIWANEANLNLDEEWEYLVDGLRRMKQFVREAASKKMALLIYLN